MLGLMAPVALALALALALGGSLSTLQRHRVEWWPLGAGALVLQLLLFNPPVDGLPWALQWGPWIWVASMAAVLLVLLRNARARRAVRHAWLVAALGVWLNLLVVVANGGYMPRAAVEGGRTIPPQRLSNVAPMGPETRLPWLGDLIAQPRWLPWANVVSVGDVLLSLGLSLWVFQATGPGIRLAARAAAGTAACETDTSSPTSA